MLSFRENIPIILKAVQEIQPKKVLDVGAGMGKYGLLIREQYLSDKAERGEIEPVDDIVIDAIEDTKYFLGDRIHSIYNSVFEKDIFQCKEIFENGKYDLILLIDTIEHWEKEKALDLLKEMVEYSTIVISTPKRIGKYKEHFYGDPRYHITQWSEADFISDFKVQIIPNSLSHIIIISK